MKVPICTVKKIFLSKVGVGGGGGGMLAWALYLQFFISFRFIS